MFNMFFDLFEVLFRQARIISRRYPKIWLTSALFSSVGLAALISLANHKAGNPLGSELRAFLHSGNAFPAIAIVTSGLGFFSFTLSYLNRTLSSNRSPIEDARRERAFLRSIALRFDEDKGHHSLGYEELRLRLLGDAAFHEQLAGEKHFTEKLTESVGSQLEKDFALKLETLANIKLTDSTFIGSEERLKAEIIALTTRSNYNLAIGCAITAGALVALVSMMSHIPVEIASSKQAVTYFIPRLSTTIFVEVFAFFFLRIYKTSLEEVKNYQTQLTNLARLRVATTSAHLFGNEQIRLVALSGLCAIDKGAVDAQSSSPINADLLKQMIDLAQQITKASSAVK